MSQSEKVARPISKEKQTTSVNASRVASIAVIVSAMVFEYCKIWTHRIGLKADSAESNSVIVKVALAVMLVAIGFKLLISYKHNMRMRIKSFFLFAVLFFVALLYYSVGFAGIDFILAGCIGFSLADEKTESTIRTTFFCCLTLFYLQILGYLLGFSTDSSTWTRAGQSGSVRLDFGFGYPTYVFTYFLPILLGLYYLQRLRFRKLLSLVCVITLVFIIVKTDTRLSLLVFLIVLLNPLLEQALKKSCLIRYIVVWLYPLAALVSIVSALILEKVQFVSSLMSGRLWYWKQYINNGVSIIGPTDANRKLYSFLVYPLDNQMLSHLFTGGIIVFCAIGIMYMHLTYSAIKTEDYRLAIIIVNTIVFGLFEANFSLGVILFLPLLFSTFLEVYYKKPL